MEHIALPFPDRNHAGAVLAKELESYKNAKNTMILALVRGGIVIGKALSDKLNLPLYPYIVRKLGHPYHREYALGALAEGGATNLDEASVRSEGIAWHDMEEVIGEEMKELKRRKEAYAVKPRPDLKGKTVILTDDGAATGASMFAAIEDVRNAKVQKIIVALPVCPPDTKEAFKRKADEVVILATPSPFYAVGQWYMDFPQIEDREVLSLLQ